ncbi:hypothetical protein [Paratractidigestivibacter sp.]|uniref:hypothetical protein n=1 Tax=Paratractidigestivibacter sp. TaxID=2847316 RepID=UPI002AC8B9E2|nr:hypothetical protein [Paratractidigestivibacter sp.]
MIAEAAHIEQGLRRDIDPAASVRALPAALSPFLAGSYDLLEAELIGERIVIARPRELDAQRPQLAKRASALARALGRPVALYLPSMTCRQRRALIESRQGFITRGGDYYLPQVSLLLSAAVAGPVCATRPFSPAQQATFLYFLYAEDRPIGGPEIQRELGISAGSASSALSELTALGLLEYSVGGRTGRKKSYRVPDKKEYLDAGLKRFGSPVRETIEAPSSVVGERWPKSGLSALAEVSDLLPPEQPVYAISRAQARGIPADPADDGARCVLKVLRYDPLLFASAGRVDPVTMMLTIDEEDERVSIALRQALEGQPWYRD